MIIDVSTQAELDQALADGNIPKCIGDGHFEVTGSATVEAGGSATVRAWDSATVEAGDSATVRAWGSATVEAGGSATVEAGGSATVRAWGSATVRAWDSATVEAGGSATVRAWDSATVRAWDSATVRAGGSATVRAWGSATVEAGGSATVRAWDSATVEAGDSATVRAWGSATVRAWDSATVEAGGSATVTAAGAAMIRALDRATITATDHVTIADHGPKTRITGGQVHRIPRPATPTAWCVFHGVEVHDTDAGKVAVLFKALNDDWDSSWGTSYAPGSTPEAPDWDGGKAECGGGLHFSPRPIMALQFDRDATRYAACPVLLDTIAVHPNGDYPEKVKAPRVVAPGCWAVDLDGTAVDGDPFAVSVAPASAPADEPQSGEVA